MVLEADPIITLGAITEKLMNFPNNGTDQLERSRYLRRREYLLMRILAVQMM